MEPTPTHNNIVIINLNNYIKKHSSPTTTYNINNNNNNNNNNNKSNVVSPDTSIASATCSHPRNQALITTQACAACKYQRRKCVSDCILAPYFPHNRQRQFLNAHRLFGVSNILKIIKNLDQPAKDHAMHTIIFQAEARAADPVGGCQRIVQELENRIALAKAELEIVLHHLTLCRAAVARQQQQMLQPPPTPDEGDHSTINGDLFGYYYNERWRGKDQDEVVGAGDDVNSWGCMHGINDDGNVHAHAESSSSSFPHHIDQDDNNKHHHVRKLSIEDYDNEVKPLENFSCDDEGEFRFDCHGNIVPSNNAVLTEEKAAYKEDDACFPYIEDHDLKAAATFFSLTNYDL